MSTIIFVVLVRLVVAAMGSCCGSSATPHSKIANTAILEWGTLGTLPSYRSARTAPSSDPFSISGFRRLKNEYGVPSVAGFRFWVPKRKISPAM